MSVDPPKDDSIHQLLQEVGKTLQENQRFLDALKQDRLAGDELDAELEDRMGEDEFEEL